MSTSLFVTKETSVATTLYAGFQNRFDPTTVWSSYHETIPSKFYGDSLRGSANVYGGGLRAPVWSYLSKLNKTAINDVDVDWKLPGDIVTSKFHISSPLRNVTKLAAPVDIFVPKIFCENAALSVLPPAEYSGTYRHIAFTSETCSNGSVPLSINPCNPRYGVETSTIHKCFKPGVYSADAISCSGSTESLYAIYGLDFDPKWSDEWPEEDMTLTMVRSTAVICKIGYEISTSKAVLDRTVGLVSFPEPFSEKEPKTLQNLSSQAFAKMIWTNLHAMEGRLIIDQKVPTVQASGSSRFEVSAGDAFFQLLYAQLGYPDTIDSFNQMSPLKNAAASLLRGMALELAQKSLLVSQSPDDRQVKAWVSVNRLFMRPAALWTMGSTFIFLALICLFLALTAPKSPWLSAMTGSIAGNASILAKNPDLQATLAGSGDLDTKELRNKLSSKEFRAKQEPTGGLELMADTTGTNFTSQELSIRKQKNKRAWLPVTVRLPVIIATYVLPLATISVLELLYHILRRYKHMV